MPRWTWALLTILGLVVLAGAWGLIMRRSQAVLDARHIAGPSAVHADGSPASAARGAHLTVVLGCVGCHGQGLSGRMMEVAGSAIWAPNLTRLPRQDTDATLEAALRQGLRRDGTTELAMPAHVYAGLTDDEVAAILGYLRGLKPQGAVLDQPSPGLWMRVNLLAGVFRPEARKVAQAIPLLVAGPRFEAGRHLAGLACGQCHGTDLRGGGGAPGPDLTLRGYYDRAHFLALMRTGDAVGGGDMALMSHTARVSFSHFTDSEIDAIFDYLIERDRLLSAKPGA